MPNCDYGHDNERVLQDVGSAANISTAVGAIRAKTHPKTGNAYLDRITSSSQNMELFDSLSEEGSRSSDSSMRGIGGLLSSGVFSEGRPLLVLGVMVGLSVGSSNGYFPMVGFWRRCGICSDTLARREPPTVGVDLPSDSSSSSSWCALALETIA